MRTGVLSATHDASQARPPIHSPIAVTLSWTGTTAAGEKTNTKQNTIKQQKKKNNKKLAIYYDREINDYPRKVWKNDF